MKNFFRNLAANQLLCLLLFCWWVLNVIQAAFTGLADDEAYYWYYATDLAWGYFDHPPVTALLVFLGQFLGGSLGIRFFFTLLLPFTCWIFWTLIRPESPSRRDALLYFIICFSLPVAQLYGFIATPDAPLMFSVAVFFWAYIRFCRKDSILNTILLGVSMALMAYSKYHGALVLILTLLSNVRILKNPRLYLGGLLTILLLVPHLLWQYHHDWASFYYHLVGRNGYFEWGNLAEFLLNMLLIFNPFLVWIYVKGWGKGEYASLILRRALYANVAGFLIVFSVSSFRGYVQPQWALPIAFGLIMIAFGWTRQDERRYRYVMRTGLVMLALSILVRIEVIFNPIGVKFEIFDNEESFRELAEVAEGRPVIFRGSYAPASKYLYYTGEDVFCHPEAGYRTSQWMFDGRDRFFCGKEVIVQMSGGEMDSTVRSILLGNGTVFSYQVVRDFHTVREITIDDGGIIPASAVPGDVVEGKIIIKNPYPYDVVIDGSPFVLEMVWGRNKEAFSEYALDVNTLFVPAMGSASTHVSFVVPEHFKVEPTYGDPSAPMKYRTGFCIKNGYLPPWIQSKERKVTICH